MESGDHAGPLWAHNMTWARKLECMHTVCLRAQAHISAKWGRIREIKISMESGEHARPIWKPNLTQACKLMCMHTICLRALAHISDKLGWIRKMRVSMESGEHTRPIWVGNITPAHKLACMHIIFLCAQTQNSAKFCDSSKIKISIKSQDYFPQVWPYSRSCKGARGPKKRRNAYQRGWRPLNGPLQERRRGAPWGPNILVCLKNLYLSLCSYPWISQAC